MGREDHTTARQLVPVRDAWKLPRVATFPRYDRLGLHCGIAHLGLGNFHRSHQALYFHEYLQTHPQEPWMIHAIGSHGSVRTLVDTMSSQDNLYTLTERSGSEATLKVIGSIKESFYAPSDPQGVIRLMASVDIKIISLTITEKGYYYDSEGNLDTSHPEIEADLREGATPTSALGYLFAAAEQRWRNKGSPFTIMSCDNLQGNGEITQRLLLQFGERKHQEVADWIQRNVSFPNSVVDRITPAVTEETSAFVRDTFGIDDRCPVVSEAYLQWILEDDFAGGRPELETVGVRFTDDVKPYETLKVRMLNGSHSALAYVAALVGFENVDAAMSDETIRTFVQRYMDDVTPTLPIVPGLDVEDYKATLIQRFSNPAISDQVQRLALDGSRKMRTFVVPALEDQLSSGGSIKWTAFALAAWYRYLGGTDDGGKRIEIDDPMEPTLVALARNGPKAPASLLSVEEIFGKRLSEDERVTTAVSECFDLIERVGTERALKRLLRQ